MAQNRAIKKNIRRLKRVKTWQLLIIFVLMCFVSATFLRLNNVGLSQLRESVYDADKAGDQLMIKNQLSSLQRYVSRHMQADPDQANVEIHLQGEYNREQDRRMQQALAHNDSSKEVINKKVDEICKPQFSGYNQGYVNCFAREFAKYSPAQSPVSEVQMPDVSEYRHSFSAPKWSFDFAGISCLITLLIGIVILARLIILLILKSILKFRASNL